MLHMCINMSGIAVGPISSASRIVCTLVSLQMSTKQTPRVSHVLTLAYEYGHVPGHALVSSLLCLIRIAMHVASCW